MMALNILIVFTILLSRVTLQISLKQNIPSVTQVDVFKMSEGWDKLCLPNVEI